MKLKAFFTIYGYIMGQEISESKGHIYLKHPGLVQVFPDPQNPGKEKIAIMPVIPMYFANQKE